MGCSDRRLDELSGCDEEPAWRSLVAGQDTDRLGDRGREEDRFLTVELDDSDGGEDRRDPSFIAQEENRSGQVHAALDAVDGPNDLGEDPVEFLDVILAQGGNRLVER